MKRYKTLTNSETKCLVLDRISGLHEHLLSQILNLLPTKEAVSTSILSRRWRHVYGWLTKLEFDASPLSRRFDCPERRRHFITHVDTVLRICHSTNVTRFCLKFGKAFVYFFDLESAHFDRWISFPLSRALRELDLCVHVKQPGKLPPQLFSLDMLEVLKINSNLELENPGSFALVNLKVLHLKTLIIPDGEFLTGLLSCCPSLLELEVKHCYCGNSPVVKISHPFLERLTLEMLPIKVRKSTRFDGVIHEDYQRTDVVLDTPNLHYLDYADNLALQYSSVNLNALVEANICIYERLEYEETHLQSLLSLLRLLAKIHSLCFSDWTYPDCEATQLREKLVFLNLNHLDLRVCDFNYCFVLLELLHCSPILERLTLGAGCGMKSDFVDANVYARLTTELESTTQSIPSCLRSRLKKIGCVMHRVSDEDFSVLKYFLRNAAVLQELDVACRVDLIQTEIVLKNLPRESVNCSIKVRFHDKGHA